MTKYWERNWGNYFSQKPQKNKVSQKKLYTDYKFIYATKVKQIRGQQLKQTHKKKIKTVIKSLTTIKSTDPDRFTAEF